MTTIDEIVDAARDQINKEIAAIEAETVRVLRKKASSAKWSEHPNHALHDKITAHYTPLIAAALKDSITNVRAVITSAQNKYAAAKAKTTKAAGDDVTTETLAQQIAREAAGGIGTSQAELRRLLTQMAGDSTMAGIRAAMTQIPGATVPADLADAFDAVDWSTWEPGNAAAADVLRSTGLQGMLDQIGAVLSGVTDTNVERAGNVIADGLSSGDSVQSIGSDIADMIGSDARALTIANTQVGQAVSMASMNTYQENGIDQYAWLVEDDGCPICQDNADNSPYDVGDDPDPSQPAHPNCRCAYIPIVNTSSDDSDTGDSADEDSDDSSDEGTDDGEES